MRTLFTIDQQNYDPALPRVYRPSVRAIILRGDRIAMAFVAKYGYYKFPGGGIEAGESHTDALIREVREETGLLVDPDSIRPFGMVRRVLLSSDGHHIFDQENYYYLCEARDGGASDPDEAEREEGFALSCVAIPDAIRANRQPGLPYIHASMAEREVRVLELLSNNDSAEIHLPKRKPNRLRSYDYSTVGAYFITICVQDMRCILATVETNGTPETAHVALSSIGETVKRTLHGINTHYRMIRLDHFIIMPNHVHLLLSVNEADPDGAPGSSPPTNTLSACITAFKKYSENAVGCKIWQRGFHDHIIRDDDDYRLHWQYIDENPKKWSTGKDAYYGYGSM